MDQILENEPSQCRILFPATINMGNRFQTLQELKQHLNNQAREANQPSLINTYKAQCRPSKADLRYLYLTCKQCPATLKLTLIKNPESAPESYFQVRQINKYHHHLTPIDMGIVEKNVENFLRENIGRVGTKSLNILKQETLKKFDISEDKYYAIRREFELKELGNYKYFRDFLVDNNYESGVDWEGGEQKSELPHIIVVISQQMKKSYLQFGDMIIFELLEGMLKNIDEHGRRYIFGVVSVLDTNNRNLIAGLVFMSLDVTQFLPRAFDILFKLNRRTPQSIVTDQTPSFITVINTLRQQKIFNGLHLYKPWQIIKNLKETLLASSKEKSQIIQIAHKLLRQRSKTKGYQLIQDLLNMTTTQNKTTIRNFIQASSNLFPFEMQPKFIGLSRSSTTRVSEIIKSRLIYVVPIINMLRQIKKIDTELYNISSTNLEIYRCPLQDQMKDTRVGEVRHGVESKVFSRFFEYYFESIRDCVKISEQNNDCATILDKSTNQHYKIIDWQCSCQEVDKSGIPCQHLICFLRSRPTEGYLVFFRRRWYKVAEKKQLDVTIKMGRKRYTRRRFTHLRLPKNLPEDKEPFLGKYDQ